MPSIDPVPSRYDDASQERDRALHRVRRIHVLRTLGLALGSLCVASVLQLHGAAPGWWVALVLHGLLWPQVAYLLAKRSADPRRTEDRSLMADSALGGMWVAVMEFNLLPSVLLVTMLSVDKVGARDPSLLARSTLLLAAGCGLTSLALGFPVQWETPISVVLACVPILVVYPLAISGVTNALARRVAEQNRLLEQVGRTDGLTGLANRRRCFAAAEREFERHGRTGRPAVLMVLDIDRFKDINDRYGHPVGDDVLRGVAAVLSECTRAIDTAGRYGGDEFMIVMPEAGLEGAAEVAGRIRARLAALRFAAAPTLHCTVSVGACEADTALNDVNVWVHDADAALYRAKSAGRDRFVAAGSAEDAEPAPRSLKPVSPIR